MFLLWNVWVNSSKKVFEWIITENRFHNFSIIVVYAVNMFFLLLFLLEWCGCDEVDKCEQIYDDALVYRISITEAVRAIVSEKFRNENKETIKLKISTRLNFAETESKQCLFFLNQERRWNPIQNFSFVIPEYSNDSKLKRRFEIQMNFFLSSTDRIKNKKYFNITSNITAKELRK